MDFLGVALRASDDGRAKYEPIYFNDWCTEEDKIKVKEALKDVLPPLVDSMFNNWAIIQVSPNLYFAKRATWTGFDFTGTLDEVIQKLKNYYKIV